MKEWFPSPFEAVTSRQMRRFCCRFSVNWAELGELKRVAHWSPATYRGLIMINVLRGLVPRWAKNSILAKTQYWRNAETGRKPDGTHQTCTTRLVICLGVSPSDPDVTPGLWLQISVITRRISTSWPSPEVKGQTGPKGMEQTAVKGC